MAAPLLLAGLSLLPKIPDMWKSVAGIFGKKVPESIEEAGELAGSVIDMFNEGKLSPEAKIELEKITNTHKETMAQLALEEKELDYKDLSDVRDLEKVAYQSGDEYVARTRPKILRELFRAVVIYCFYAPLCIIAATQAGIPPTTTIEIIALVKWVGGWLFGTFGTAYLGYAGARTIDKRNPAFKDSTGLINKATNFILKK